MFEKRRRKELEQRIRTIDENIKQIKKKLNQKNMNWWTRASILIELRMVKKFRQEYEKELKKISK